MILGVHVLGESVGLKVFESLLGCYREVVLLFYVFLGEWFFGYVYFSCGLENSWWLFVLRLFSGLGFNFACYLLYPFQALNYTMGSLEHHILILYG